MKVFATALSATGITAALLAGCSDPSAPAGQAAAQSPAGPISQAEKDLLYQAEELLVRDCMRAAGFEYAVVSRPSVPQYREFYYVVDDQAWAARHGYGTELRKQLDAQVDRNPNDSYYRGLPETRRIAAAGTFNGPRPEGLSATLPNGMPVQHSDQGCTAEAWGGLYGDTGAWYRSLKIVENLTGERVGSVTADPRFSAAVKAWSKCMRSRGRQVRTPSEARERYSGTSRRAEVAAARDEADCANRTPLAVTAKALDTEYGTRQNQKFDAAIQTAQRLQRAALPRAREIAARPR